MLSDMRTVQFLSKKPDWENELSNTFASQIVLLKHVRADIAAHSCYMSVVELLTACFEKCNDRIPNSLRNQLVLHLGNILFYVV